MQPPSPLASKRQSLMLLRHVSITAFSAAAWPAAPSVMLMCPVESDIAIAVQSLSARATGVAATATPTAITANARLFMGYPALFYCAARLWRR